VSTPVHKLFVLTGKTALIMGGSRGLRLQIAQAPGEAGARVMLTSRKSSDLEEPAALFQAKGTATRWIAAKGAAVLFASQAGKHITGQRLPIDGGVCAVIAA
jgi:hypothetical protein